MVARFQENHSDVKKQDDALYDVSTLCETVK